MFRGQLFNLPDAYIINIQPKVSSKINKLPHAFFSKKKVIKKISNPFCSFKNSRHIFSKVLNIAS